MKGDGEALLGQTPPFAALTGTQLREALALAHVRRLELGGVVFAEEEPALRFHLLLSGHVRYVRVTAEGRQIIMLHVQAGEVFGVGAVLGRAVHRASAIAADDCVALSWPGGLWPVFAARYPGFAAETFRAYRERVDEMSTRIVELSTKPVDQRVACALLRLAGQSGQAVAGGILIGFPVTRQNMADLTGTTLHTVSRLLRGWERAGLIRSGRGSITVTDAVRMEAIGAQKGAGVTRVGHHPI